MTIRTQADNKSVNGERETSCHCLILLRLSRGFPPWQLSQSSTPNVYVDSPRQVQICLLSRLFLCLISIWVPDWVMLSTYC